MARQLTGDDASAIIDALADLAHVLEHAQAGHRANDSDYTRGFRAGQVRERQRLVIEIREILSHCTEDE